MRKLGLIAGGGDLPVRLARQCQAVGRPLFVLRLKGMADPELAAFDGADVGIAEARQGLSPRSRARRLRGGLFRRHRPSGPDFCGSQDPILARA